MCRTFAQGLVQLFVPILAGSLLFTFGQSVAQTVAPAHAQGAVVAAQRSRIVATEPELFRLKEQPRTELAKLDAEQRLVCQPNPTSAACKAHIDAHKAKREALLLRIDFSQRHVPAAHKPGSCSTCHMTPGAAGASDPIQPGLKPPVGGAGPATGGASNDGGPKVIPPATRCFIATAAWGSPFAPEVAELRRFRDERLLTNAVGRAFVAAYVDISPPIADAIADRPLLRAAVRATLVPVVASIRHPGAALLLLVLTAIGLVFWRLRKRHMAP